MPVTLSIDGAVCVLSTDTSLLDAAASLGATIPTLCHDPRVPPDASCGVCVVEVREGGRWRQRPSCSTRAAAGMEVRTASPALEEARRFALELLLSDHWADCVAPCTLACPAGVDVPGYVRALAEDRPSDAVAIVQRTNPLASSCGRICPHACESACRRGLVDSPIAINALKRAATEQSLARHAPEPLAKWARAEQPNEKARSKQPHERARTEVPTNEVTRERRADGPPPPIEGSESRVRPRLPAEGSEPLAAAPCVAVVGAGPAGLAAAWFLRDRGHRVVVFDAQDEPGGMLRYGIPAFRLPREVLARDVEAIVARGVELRMGRRLGGELTPKSMLSNGFSAVLLALGAWKGRRLGVPGDDASGVMGGVAFLRAVNSPMDGRARTDAEAIGGVAFLKEVNGGRTSSGAVSADISAARGGVVAVVGGGNTAIDAARAAVRLGAARVVLLYRRDRAQMPAFASEVDAAEREGVEVRCLVAPLAVEVGAGRVVALSLQRMALGAPDASGRPRPVPLDGPLLRLPVDLVIAALGEEPDASGAGLPDGPRANRATGETAIAGVFAAGDFATGPSTAVEAIASGRRAAHAIDRFLRTGRAEAPRRPVLSRRDALAEVGPRDYGHVACADRPALPEREPAIRRRDFDEVELGLDADAARAEAERCMQCGCAAFDTCALRTLMEQLGADPTAARGRAHRYASEDLRPGIAFDMNKCIRCTRCVRVCDVLAEVGALSMANRGFDTRLIHALATGDEQARCDACMAAGAPCVATCPTGALTLTPPPTRRAASTRAFGPALCPTGATPTGSPTQDAGAESPCETAAWLRAGSGGSEGARSGAKPPRETATWLRSDGRGSEGVRSGANCPHETATWPGASRGGSARGGAPK